MSAACTYQIENRWSAHAANDNVAVSARAKLKLRLAARRRFYSLDQISRCTSITDGADSGNNRSYGYDASGKLVHVQAAKPLRGMCWAGRPIIPSLTIWARPLRQ